MTKISQKNNLDSTNAYATRPKKNRIPKLVRRRRKYSKQRRCTPVSWAFFMTSRLPRSQTENCSHTRTWLWKMTSPCKYTRARDIYHGNRYTTSPPWWLASYLWGWCTWTLKYHRKGLLWCYHISWSPWYTLLWARHHSYRTRDISDTLKRWTLHRKRAKYSRAGNSRDS